MLGWKVATQSLLGDLEFARSITVGEESQSLMKQSQLRSSLDNRATLTMQMLRMVCKGTFLSAPTSTACE